MMALQQIEELSRQAARKAARDRKHPLMIEQDDILHAKRSLSIGRMPDLGIPFIGGYVPRGYKRVGEAVMVDSSGFGQEGEPALTIPQFIEQLVPGFAYAVVEAGQFQVYVQRYERKAVQS